MNTPEEHAQAIKDEARKIAADGKDIRRRIEILVQQLSRELKHGSRKLVDVAQNVIDGATQGIADAAPPDDKDNRLRQVIDGLGDGFAKAANATKLAIEEAAARGQHFAKNDMEDMASDLRSLRDMFVDVVSRTAMRASATAKTEAQDTSAHVKRTFESLKPSLDKAVNAAKADPAALSKETADAISKASRQVAGALFAAVGDLMQHAASKLDPDHKADQGKAHSKDAGTPQAGAADDGVSGGEKV